MLTEPEAAVESLAAAARSHSGTAKRHGDLDGSLDDLCGVHEEASNSRDASETGATEFVNTIYYPLLRLGGDPTAFSALEVGVTSSRLDVWPADDVADKDDQFFRLAAGADDANPGCGKLKPLPGVVSSVGSLAVYRPKYGYITTAFGLVIDVESTSKHIWLVHGGERDDERQDECDKICADLLSEYGEDNSEPRGAEVDSHTPVERICDEHQGPLIVADKTLSGSSARGGYIRANPSPFDITWLDQTWDELLSPYEPSGLRRTRIARGIAASARRVGPRLQTMNKMEILSMGAEPK
ncbi:hypothetical protein DL765_001641 [Monosporascus sp. GIB2]|nr:hypothetical protein DL765_001641 [Monosporascus sp. GIB2]